MSINFSSAPPIPPDKITFEQDNFALRRANSSACGVAYDPESLITGAEVDEGLTYLDPRKWQSSDERNAAIAGNFTPEVIPNLAPRMPQPQHEAVLEVLALLDIISPDSDETGYGDSVAEWLKTL